MKFLEFSRGFLQQNQHSGVLGRSAEVFKHAIKGDVSTHELLLELFPDGWSGVSSCLHIQQSAIAAALQATT